MWKALDIDTWREQRQSGIEGVRGPVQGIIDEVRIGGDRAVVQLTERFDKIRLDSFVVTEEEREEAYNKVDARLAESLIEAEARITQFHELQKSEGLWLRETEPGIILGVKTTPLERVGTYVPGGRAAYPSTALMTAVPARVAGVKEICCCSPPPIHPATLLALDIAGVNEIYRIGGAQAIAAMALGTETINPVQKIVGPGNVYVTAAKMMLREHAEIDFPAGPSEIGIIADESANPDFIAADILAQAEHDPNAACALITTDEHLPGRVQTSLEALLSGTARREIIESALTQSGYVVVPDIRSAIDVSDHIAPEHLSIQVADPFAVLSGVHNAGSIFVGHYAPVACGDYASGTSHVLPTAGYARQYSGLDVHHFCKTSTVQIVEKRGLEAIGDVIETIADAEGLHAHAESVRIRRRS